MAKKPAASAPAQFYCGRCSQSFSTKSALTKHLKNHPDSESTELTCPVCHWPFADSLALENHCIVSGHLPAITPQRPVEYRCDRCSDTFKTQRDYNRHLELGQPCCDAFHSTDWKKNRRPEYVDPDKPKQIFREVPTLAYGDSTGTPSEVSNSDAYCIGCRKSFTSEATYTRHALGCSLLNSTSTLDSSTETLRAPNLPHHQGIPQLPALPTPERHTMTVEIPTPYVTPAHASRSIPLQTITLNVKQPVHHQLLPQSNAPKGLFSAPTLVMPRSDSTPAPPHMPVAPSANSAGFVCSINGCQKSYNSEPGLKMHQTDAHGVGGKGLDLHGKDSWMLGQRERERLRAEGLLRIPTGPLRGGRGSRGGSRGGRAAPVPASLAATRMPLLQVTSAQRAPATTGPYHQVSPQNAVSNAPPPLPTSLNIGGALEMDQAKFICGKTLRLLLQNDIFIHHDGRMSVGGIDWTRIGVEQQPAVVGMFNDLCHLPRKLQPLEYVPAPKTFMNEYTAQYPMTEFEGAPVRDPAKPGLGIIALACSKIVLSNGCQDVVKIAAVDVLTCRVLMSHLVCTDPNVQVVNWRSSVTGLTSFKDMEEARQAGYKVLKGWPAARAALFKFVDKETIIVGHNLRSDLDALRIIHGRAVDIAKVVEKAAQGPLSKVQVSLDSWCRDFANVAKLNTDPVFGRDCVMDAFAAREIGLWGIKNREKLEKVAKQKTKEYQSVNPIKA